MLKMTHGSSAGFHTKKAGKYEQFPTCFAVITI